MSESHFLIRQRQRTLDALRHEITPVDDPNEHIAAEVHNLTGSILRVLSRSDDELREEEPDIRKALDALQARLSKIGA